MTYTNHEIMSYFSKLSKVTNYCGIFSADSIPKTLYRAHLFSFICNLSKVKEEGTHWIAIVYIKGVLIYLDPLGLNNELNSCIRNFMLKVPARIFCSINKPLQNTSSDLCGLFCIFFILLFDNPDLVPSTLIPFSEDTKLNDEICKKNLSIMTEIYR